MTAGALAALLAIGLLASAVAGPRLLGRAAPALMRLPKLAVVLLAGVVVAWVLGFLALGPLLAWLLSGPVILPGNAAEVCQQCLAAANPFSSAPINTVIPVALLLIVPAIGAALHGLSIIVEWRSTRRSTRQTAQALRRRATTRRVHDFSVLVTDDRHPFALTLPRRLGGIVVSQGALGLLSPIELTAVLAHEDAHLRQRHHLVSTVVSSLTRWLRWVPVLAAAQDALSHYLEIAADAHARRRVGPTPLASALLTLGQHGHPLQHEHVLDGALHVLGPDRVRHLVRPGSGMTGVVATGVSVGGLATLVLLSAFVHVPYAAAALSGCM